MKRGAGVRRVIFAPEIMLTPGEAVLAFLALSAGPVGAAALVAYLLHRAARDRAGAIEAEEAH